MFSDLFEWVTDTFFGSSARATATATAVSAVASYASARNQRKALNQLAPSAIKVSAPPAPVKFGQMATTIPRSGTSKTRKHRSFLASGNEPTGLLS